MLLYEDDDSQWFLEEDDDVTLQNDMESMTIDDIEYGYLLSIDIGVIHLGLSILAYDKNTYKFKDVMGVDCLDITTFPHPDQMLIWPVGIFIELLVVRRVVLVIILLHAIQIVL